MSEQPVPVWTIEALKEHLEALITASERRVSDLLDAERQLRLARREDDLRAIEKAETAMTRRLNAMNEIRAELDDVVESRVSEERFKGEVDKIAALVERNRISIVETREMALPRETFDAALTEWTVWRSSIDRFLRNREGAERGLSVLGSTLVKTIAAAVGILTFVVVLADHFAR